MNGQHISIAKIDESFVFHSHPESEKVLYVLSGRLTMKFEDRDDIIMETGDMYVVDTMNTGDTPASERTRAVHNRFHGNQPNDSRWNQVEALL